MGYERFTQKGVAQRKSPRERKDQTVRLEFDDGSSPIRGTLSDLSATGARIALSGPYNMPVKFAVVLPPATRRLCRLVWQSRENIGLEFLGVRTRAPAQTIGEPQHPLQGQLQDRQQRAAGPARAGTQGSKASSPRLWNYWENQRPKR